MHQQRVLLCLLVLECVVIAWRNLRARAHLKAARRAISPPKMYPPGTRGARRQEVRTRQRRNATCCRGAARFQMALPLNDNSRGCRIDAGPCHVPSAERRAATGFQVSNERRGVRSQRVVAF